MGDRLPNKVAMPAVTQFAGHALAVLVAGLQPLLWHEDSTDQASRNRQDSSGGIGTGHRHHPIALDGLEDLRSCNRTGAAIPAVEQFPPPAFDLN